MINFISESEVFAIANICIIAGIFINFAYSFGYKILVRFDKSKPITQNCVDILSFPDAAGLLVGSSVREVAVSGGSIHLKFFDGALLSISKNKVHLMEWDPETRISGDLKIFIPDSFLDKTKSLEESSKYIIDELINIIISSEEKKEIYHDDDPAFDRYEISALASGSAWVTVKAFSRRSARALRDVGLIVFNEGRENLLERMRLETGKRRAKLENIELRNRQIEQDMAFRRAENSIKLLKNIEGIKDLELRAKVKEEFLAISSIGDSQDGGAVPKLVMRQD